MEKTAGEIFLLDLEAAETKGLVYALLEKTFLEFYPKIDLEKYIDKLSDFASVATYQGKLAKIRIEYNARAVNEIRQRLVGLVNFGEDNYKYKEKIIRKLNLLIANYPTADETLYLAIAYFLNKKMGTVEEFKQGLKTHIAENQKAEYAS